MLPPIIPIEMKYLRFILSPKEPRDLRSYNYLIYLSIKHKRRGRYSPLVLDNSMRRPFFIKNHALRKTKKFLLKWSLHKLRR